MSLSSRYLAPCIPPTQGCSGTGCTGEIRGGLPDQSGCREMLLAPSCCLTVHGDRNRTDSLPGDPGCGRSGSPRAVGMRQHPGGELGSARPRWTPPGAARSDGCSAGCQPLPGCHRALGTGQVGEARGARQGGAPAEAAPVPPCPVPGPGLPRGSGRDLRGCGCRGSPALRHLLVLLLGLLQHLSISGLHSFDHDAPLHMGF